MADYFPFHPRRATSKESIRPPQYLPDDPSGFSGSMSIGQDTYFTPFQPMLIAQPMAFPVYVDNKESFGANYNRRYPSPPLDDCM